MTDFGNKFLVWFKQNKALFWSGNDDVLIDELNKWFMSIDDIKNLDMVKNALRHIAITANNGKFNVHNELTGETTNHDDELSANKEALNQVLQNIWEFDL